jgi:hypothetical protein
MNINSDIVFDNLKEYLPVKMYGSADAELCLKRPVLCLGDEKAFRSGQLYITQSDHLPQRPTIEKGSVIVCIGESLNTAYYRERCRVITVDNHENLFSVFNLVQGVYNKYDSWNECLYGILNSTAKVPDMVECSRAIFGNPLFVIDANFHFLAYSGYASGEPDDPYAQANDNDNLRLSTLGQFLELSDFAMQVKEPQLINLLDSNTLNTNLFDNEDYLGCLTVDYRLRPHRVSDIVLVRHLAKFITSALKKHSAVLSSERSALRQILQDIVEGLPIDAKKRRALETANLNREYICVKMEYNSRLSQAPIGYICNMVEDTLPKSIAFGYDASIVGFVDTETIRENDGTYKNRLRDIRDIMETFIQSLDMRIGISDAFSDLHSARLYYQQADAALKNGRMIHPDERFFAFQDYALMEMLINSLGELPAEMFHSEGTRRLTEHDKANPDVSYMETLRVYLDQNMSITKTAAALFIHRSTLLERLDRIERVLNADMKNPDERLRLQILLKVIQLQKTIQGKLDAL